MAQAERYTAFLVDLVVGAGGTSAALSVADFGAGAGLFADLIRPRTAQLSCIEPDAQLRQLLEARGHRTVAQSSAIPNASMDYIYSLNVLEHIAEDHVAAAEMFRMLKPGGRLLVYVPAFRCLYSAMDRKVGHLRRYRRGELVRLLRQAGFSVERSAYADCLGFFASLLYRFIGPADGRINLQALIAYDRMIFPASRALDRLLGRFFGKNVFVVAHRPADRGLLLPPAPPAQSTTA